MTIEALAKLLQSTVSKLGNFKRVIKQLRKALAAEVAKNLAKDLEATKLKDELKVLKNTSKRILISYVDLTNIKGNFKVEVVREEEHMFASKYRWITML